jgi:hypothetical protein
MSIDFKNFSEHITYQAQINPVVVKKQLQISLDSRDGALQILEPSKQSPFKTAKLVFQILDTGDQLLVKTSLLEKEMRKFSFGNFQDIFKGKYMSELKPILNTQEKAAYKAELVKRFFPLKEAGAYFFVPIRFFTVTDLKGLFISQDKEDKNTSYFKEEQQVSNLPVFPKDSIVETVKSNLENDFDKDLSKEEIELILQVFTEIYEKKNQASYEEKKSSFPIERKAVLLEALDYVIQRFQFKYN